MHYSFVALTLGVLLGSLPGVAETDGQPSDSVSAASLCERALLNFQAEAIRFNESGTEMRPSGQPVLDRVVALASTCPQSLIDITGHTDSSGNEFSNQRLSLERAQAVADLLVARGIAKERLVVSGIGSSDPVADNAKRYGRSLNRRIEIVMRPTPADGLSRPRSPPDS